MRAPWGAGGAHHELVDPATWARHRAHHHGRRVGRPAAGHVGRRPPHRQLVADSIRWPSGRSRVTGRAAGPPRPCARRSPCASASSTRDQRGHARPRLPQQAPGQRRRATSAWSKRSVRSPHAASPPCAPPRGSCAPPPPPGMGHQRADLGPRVRRRARAAFMRRRLPRSGRPARRWSRAFSLCATGLAISRAVRPRPPRAPRRLFSASVRPSRSGPRSRRSAR